MERIKTAYKNMALKRALTVTVAFSLALSFLLSVFALAVTRPSYYKLTTANLENRAIYLHNVVTIFLLGICIAVPVIQGIYFFCKHKLSVPMQALMDGTNQIAYDNLDFTIQYDANDELGTLCKSFDKMREELQRNYKQMWRMTEERKELNAAFAHDLRTPLTVLRGYTDFLGEYIPSPNKNDEKLLSTNHMMAQYIKRLEDYVETMNTIQKLEDTPIKIESVPIDDFMEMLTDNVKLTAEEYDKKFSVIDDTGLSVVKGDIPLIFRALENIARNAFQYAKSQVYIRLFLHDDKLYIEVIDDGTGFRKNDLEQALNPFYTSAKADDSHYGIGLNICKTLCKNHGGNISIDNTQNSGAKVKISFMMKNR